RGADFQSDGLALRSQGMVGANSQTDQFFSKFTASNLEELNSLSAGQLGYYAMQLNPDVLRACARVKGLFFGARPEAGAIEKGIQELADANPHWVAGDFNMPPSGLQAWRFDNPAKAEQAQLQEYRALQSGDFYQSAMLKDKPEVKVHAKQHRNFQLNYVHLTWDFDKMLHKQGVQAGADNDAALAAMKRLLGEGVEIWFGTDGRAYVVVSAPGWDNARQRLDAYLDHKDTV